MSNKTTALATAIKGGKVSDKQAQSALGQAVDRITGLSKRAEKSKDQMVETGTMVLHSAETQGSLFLSSLAEGYFGPDRLKIGSVDLRAPIGLLAQGYGLYETMAGRKGGGHALALGNGVMGSWLASVAVNAGKLLAEKRAASANPTAAEPPAPTTVTVTPITMQGHRALPAPTLIPEPGLSGPVREVVLTEGEEVGRRRHGGGRKGRMKHAQRGGSGNAGNPGRRFIRPEPEEDDEDPDDSDPNE
jgi:hypothetical protein